MRSAPGQGERADSLFELAAIVAAGCVGEVAPMVVPLFLGGIITEFGISEGTAGFVPALEVGAIAGGAILFSTRGRKLEPRFAVWAAVALVILGQAVSTAVDAWHLFVGSRILVGLGEGVLVASANIQASLTRRPHRTFSLLLAAIIICFVGMASGIPVVTAAAGPRGAFAALLALAIVATVFTVRFPGRRVYFAPRKRGGWFFSAKGRLLMAASFVYVAFSALWVYLGQIGASLGMSLGQIGVLLTACGVAGAFGPMAAGLIGLRWGRTGPLLSSLMVVAATAVTLAAALSPGVFVLSAIAIMMSFMFFVTYFRGLLAAVDPSGGLVGVGVGVLLIGGAVGPLFAGVLLNIGGSYLDLGLMAVGCCSVAVVMVTPIARGADQPT